MRRKYPKITKHAKGQECQVQIFPYCNQNPETTVFAHAWCEDKGVGIKSPDWFGAFACSACHDIIDGRHQINDMSLPEIHKAHLNGVYRTWKILIEDGIIKID